MLEKSSFSPKEYKIWVKKRDIFRMVEGWSPSLLVSTEALGDTGFSMSPQGSLFWEYYFSATQISPFQYGYSTGSSISSGKRKSTPDFQKVSLFDVKTVQHWKILFLAYGYRPKLKVCMSIALKIPSLSCQFHFAFFLNVMQAYQPGSAAANSSGM